jgi:hypothetical protein
MVVSWLAALVRPCDLYSSLLGFQTPLQKVTSVLLTFFLIKGMNVDPQDEEILFSDDEIASNKEDDTLSVGEDEDITCQVPLSLNKVWDSPKIRKFIGAENGDEKWTCFHCNGTWSKWNHSKVIWHLLGGPDIQRCQAKIPDKWMARYHSLSKDKETKATNKEVAKWCISNIMDSQADDAYHELKIADPSNQDHSPKVPTMGPLHLQSH